MGKCAAAVRAALLLAAVEVYTALLLVAIAALPTWSSHVPHSRASAHTLQSVSTCVFAGGCAQRLCSAPVRRRACQQHPRMHAPPAGLALGLCGTTPGPAAAACSLPALWPVFALRVCLCMSCTHARARVCVCVQTRHQHALCACHAGSICFAHKAAQYTCMPAPQPSCVHSMSCPTPPDAL